MAEVFWHKLLHPNRVIVSGGNTTKWEFLNSLHPQPWLLSIAFVLFSGQSCAESISAKQRNDLAKLCRYTVGKIMPRKKKRPVLLLTWVQSTKPHVSIKHHWNISERQQICMVDCHSFREPHSSGQKWVNQHSACSIRCGFWPQNLLKSRKSWPKLQVNKVKV